MFSGLFKNISKVFSFRSGKQNCDASPNAFSSKSRVAGYSYGYSSSSTPYLHLTGGMNFFVDPEVILNLSSACGKLLSYIVARVSSKKDNTTRKESLNGSKGTVNTSQSTNGSMLKDEGYQSALDCTTCKHVENSLLKMEESYKQQIHDLEFELELQYKFIEKNYDMRNKLMGDDESEGKGKGGKGYVKKMCNLEEEQLILKEHYVSKIKSEKKYLRFHQLDDETQLMICKIDALRESKIDNKFFDELLKMFERKSMELEKLKNTVGEMKELEDDYAKTIDELVEDHEKVIEEKDQEINCLKKKLQDALVGKVRRGCSGEPSRIKSGRKDVKIEDLDDECQLMIANIEALRKSDNIIYGKVLNMLEQQNTKV